MVVRGRLDRGGRGCTRSFAGSPPSSPSRPPVAPALADPGVTLSPGSGPPTSAVRVSASGFDAFELVDVFVDTTDVALASANAAGSFGGVTVTVPSSALPGAHWITAAGRRSTCRPA